MMEKKEELKKSVENRNNTIFNWIEYFLLIRKLKKYEKRGYSGFNLYSEINPWIVNKLKEDGFKVIENLKDKEGKEYTFIKWVIR